MRSTIFLLPLGLLLIAAGQLPPFTPEPGTWEIAVPGEPARAICLADEGALVQLGHPGTTCSRKRLGSDRAGTTIRYECPAAGWGQTSLKFTGPRAARINTQGIAGGAPFAYVAEARRTGDCPVTSERR